MSAGVKPLIENVPPVLRMRTGSAFFTPVGGHWRDLQLWQSRVPDLGFTLDTSHAALFRAFAAAYPSLFGLAGDEGLELERYVEELGPGTFVAHVSNASGILGEGLDYDDHDGELDLDPVVARLGQLVPFVVAEINEPDHSISPHIKDGYRHVERALALPAETWRPPPRRLPPESLDWQAVIGRRDPVPDVLGLADRLDGARVLVTGGAGSIGRSLTNLLAAFRPELIPYADDYPNEQGLSPAFLRQLEDVGGLRESAWIGAIGVEFEYLERIVGRVHTAMPEDADRLPARVGDRQSSQKQFCRYLERPFHFRFSSSARVTPVSVRALCRGYGSLSPSVYAAIT